MHLSLLTANARVDATVGALWRIIHFAICGVAGPGVVPGLRTFERAIVEGFEHGDRNGRIELLKERAERGAHDARARSSTSMPA